MLPLKLAHVLLEILEDKNARPRDRIAAVQELWDRGWGKAPAFAAIEAENPLELDAIDLEIQRIAEDLRAEREKDQPLTAR